MLLCLGALTLPVGAHAQGTVDNSYVSVSACNVPISSCTVFVGSTVPQGDAIMVVASWGGAATTATINDGHNTYKSIFGPSTAATGDNRGQAWIVPSTSSGVTQATVTLSAPSTTEQVLIWIIPIKGLDPISPIDANVTHVNAGSGTNMSTGISGIFSSVPNEMIWGIFLEDNYSTPYAPGSGFFNLSGQEAASLLEDKSVTQTGIQTAVGTNGNGTNNWIGAVIGLKAAGQNGGTTPTISSIAVTPANPSIVAGVTQQFTATGTYSDGSTQNLTGSVTWTSSNTTVATISASGLASAASAGNTTIQAALTSVTGSTGLTVTASNGGDSGSTLPGLVGYWTFNEGSGTTAADSSGNGLTATLSNGITWTTGAVGGAVSGNGVNQYITIPALNLTGTSAASVAMWVNRTYTNGAGDVLLEFSNNFNNTNNAFGFFPEGAADCGRAATEIGLIGNNGYDIKCYPQPSSGTWHQLVVVYDYTQAAASSIAFYVDGQLQTALSQPYSSNNSAKFGNYPIYLFSRGGTSSFSPGQIGDLQIYNRALTASDVQTLYNSIEADFTLTALPSSQTVFQGSGTTYTAAVSPLNGFSGSVALTATGLPAGATASFSPAQVSSGSSTLSVTTASTTPPGSYTVTITGTSGTLTHSANITLVVNATATPDFAISAAPSSQTVSAGSGTTYTPTITASGGFSGVVSLTVSGLPAGATGTFSPASVSGSGSSTLTVTTSASTLTGSYTLSITGTSGSLTHSATAILVVSAAPTFSVAAAPSSQTVIQGASTTFTPTITALNGFSAAVTFSISGLPTGATGTFNPASVTGSGTSTLTIATAATTATGSYTLTITGTSGSLIKTSTVALVITAASSGGGSAGTLPGLVGYWTFNEGSGTTAADSSGNNLTATLSNGVTWATGKVGGAISANGSNQYVTIPAINLSSTSAASVAMWVNRTYTGGAGDVLFEFSNNFNSTNNAFGFFPEGAADCGVPATEISLRGNNGYDVKCYTQPTSGVWHLLVVVYDMSQSAANSVAFYVDGVQQTSLSQPYSSTNTSTFGNYPTYLFSRGGTGNFSSGSLSDLQIYNRALTASDVQSLFNSAAPSFTLTASPASQTVVQGNATSYTATITPVNGFNGSVSLSASGLPAGASASFSLTQVSSGASTLTITTDPTLTPAGSYSVRITGTSGSLIQTSTVTLVVNAPPTFSLAAAPSSQTVIQGSSTTFTPTVTGANGFSAGVAFSVSGLPTGATGTFVPASVTGSGSSTLTIATAATTPTGSYTLTITGTSGSLAQSSTVTLVVNAAAQANFTLTSAPTSRTVVQGTSTTYVPTVTPSNGFSGTVTFSVSGLPTGASATFNPTTVTTTGSTTMTVVTSLATPVGTYPLVITGTSGSLSTTVTVSLVITGTFSISISPSAQTVLGGLSTTYTVTETPGAGFTGNVSLSVSGLPSGGRGTFSPTTITGSGSSTLTVTTSIFSSKRTYTLTITGTSGGITSRSTATLTVQ